MYQLHPDIVIHAASDRSGVVVYNDYSGDLLRLPIETAPLFDVWREGEPLSESDMRAALAEVLPDYADQIMDMIFSKHLLIETQNASA